MSLMRKHRFSSHGGTCPPPSMHIAFVNHVQSETGTVLSKARYNAPDDEGATVREVRPS